MNKAQKAAVKAQRAAAKDSIDRRFIEYVKVSLGLDVIAEFKFHPTRRWRNDYAILSHGIIIEVEGGAWIGGRHTSGYGFLNDMVKYNEVTCMGYKLIRTTPTELFSAKTLDNIKRLSELK